jgi:GGDEF domain-containing protein
MVGNYFISFLSIKRNLEFCITVFCGMACFPTHGQIANQVISAADQALLVAKKRGRNCVIISQNKFL